MAAPTLTVQRKTNALRRVERMKAAEVASCLPQPTCHIPVRLVPPSPCPMPSLHKAFKLVKEIALIIGLDTCFALHPNAQPLLMLFL